MNFTWIELKKFIKYNIKKIIIGTLILGTIFAATILLLNRNTKEASDGKQNKAAETSIAYFQYYSEREDGSALTNLSVVREYFTREELIKEWADELNIQLENVAVEDELLFTENLDFVNDEDMVGQTVDDLGENKNIVNINLYKGDYSHLFTLTVTSDDEQQNLKIAEYYYNLIENDEVPFYHDKHIYIFTEPQISERLIKVDDTVEIDITENNSLNYLNIVVGYILSLIVVSGFCVLKTLFSKKIFYSFSYLWDEKHQFLLFDPMKNNLNELIQFLNYPESKNKIILTENDISADIHKLLFTNTHFLEHDLPVYNNVIDFNLDTEVDEIILLVNEGKTTRKWYKEQQDLLSIYNKALVKIVQFNQ